MAKVFIGIPTINRPEFVRHTIRSALAQTYSDFEIIVSDNCSEAGVADSIEKFIVDLQDDRIRFYQQKENVGEYGQGRYFLSQANACEYFMILHDDDLLFENYLEKAIGCLQKTPSCVAFVADVNIIDEWGDEIESEKQKFFRDFGSNGRPQGEISILDTNLECGFIPISGTLFRTEILRTSGFVHDEGIGNYPFEFDVFICLGDLRVKAWYQKENLLAFRVHPGAMKNYMKLLHNEVVLNAFVHLLELRQYDGYTERCRKMILCRLYRAKALIAVRQSRFTECRNYIKKCFGYNALSVKLWVVAPFAFIAPGILKWILPEIPVAREAPAVPQKK